MKTARIFPSWASVSPDAETIDLSDIEEQLKINFNKGLYTFVSLTTLDSEGIDDIPLRFHNSSGQVQWTNSNFILQYTTVLDQLIPLCEQVFLSFVVDENNSKIDSTMDLQ